MSMKMQWLISIALILIGSPALAVNDGGNGSQNKDPHRRLYIGGDCIECDFRNSNLAGARVHNGDFSRADFRDSTLIDAHFIELKLDQANFTDAELSQARFTGTSLVGATFTDARMSYLHAQRVDLSQAQMDHVTADNSVFVLSSLYQINGHSASFDGANFRSCNMREAVLENASLERSRIQGTDLTNANLSDADLSEALIINSNLSQVVFDGADLSGVRFRNVDLTGADLRNADGLTEDALRHTCGDDSTQLPDYVAITLDECSSTRNFSSWPTSEFVFVMNDNFQINEVKEMEAARAAVTIAMEGVEENMRMREHAMAESHQRLAEIRATLEEAEQIERVEDMRETLERKIGPDMTWNYTLRRSEIGEPLQIILEGIAGLEGVSGLDGELLELDGEIEMEFTDDEDNRNRIFLMRTPGSMRYTISRELQCQLEDEELNEEACEDYIRVIEN